MSPDSPLKSTKYVSTAALVLILAVSGFLMLNVSSQESAVMDELAHIPSGYGYVRYFDYRLNPEHPPVIKALAAIPLLFLNLNYPTNDPSWQTEINGQWDVGAKFLYGVNDTRADTMLFWARIFPIILTLLLIACVYLWSKKLFGPIWALLPTLLVGLSPNFIAHGHYVTTDVGAALGFFISLWAYYRYTEKTSSSRLWIAGIAFGIAQILKFSTVLLVPLLAFFALVQWWLKSKSSGVKIFSKPSLKILWKHIYTLILIFAIGYLLVWLVYGIFTMNYPIQKQISDTTSILQSFGGGPDPTWQKCPPHGLGMRCLADINIWLSSKPILRGLGQYMLGVLMVIQRSAGGNTAYFLGSLGGAGWWYYFPVVFLLKEPLPTLILIGLGLLLAISRFIKHTKERQTRRTFNYLELNFAEFIMISAVIFYWVYSIKSSLNIGFRHILPTLPLMYILASGSFKKWVGKVINSSEPKWWQKFFTTLKNVLSASLKVLLIAFLGVWLIVEVAVAYPYYLSYFNEIGGGVWNGYKYVTDSNYDWGQDLKRLKDYVDTNNIDKIAVDYFGGGNVGYYLGDKAVDWNSAKGNPLAQGIKWLAVSANTIQSAKATPTQGQVIKLEDSYPWLTNYQTPYARAGTSIFIYRLQ